MKRLALIAPLVALLCLLTARPARAADLSPNFGFIAPGWIQVPGTPFDLSAVWHAFGFQESGLSTAFVGAPKPGSSTWERFDPDGGTYECFFGTYVIRNFKFASEWHAGMTAAEVTDSANELIALGNVDQFAWLSFYSAPFGGPTASTYVPNSLHITGPLPNGFFVLTFLVDTTSDLGTNTPPAPWVPPYSTFAAEIPMWEPIVVEASVLVKFDAPSGDFLAVFGSGAEYTDSGEPKNTPAGTFVQIGEMIAATTFQ